MNCTDCCEKKSDDKGKCPDSCFNSHPQFYTSSAPPLPPDCLGDDQTDPSRVISTNLLIITCILGGVFLLGVCWMVSMKFYSRWRNSRRLNSPPIFNDTHEDFLDGNHGPVIDHPIWYIHTVGLQQSVIDSITTIRYKKDEGLIDGTECSVCLSEFQEDESLRLLPKCSHAFHLPCIDTWLRSHKNCPLCRAPIVRDAGGSGFVSTTESNSIDLSSRENEDPQVENLENHGGMLSHQHGEIGGNEVRARSEDLDASPMEIERISEILKKGLPYLDARNGEFRVKSDLVDNRRVAEEESQVRRSVSLDSSSASVIYRAMANATELEEGSSNYHSAQVKNQNCGIFSKRSSGGSSSLYKLMKSSSIGRSMQKRPVLMKRSFSSGGKLSVPRHSRSKTCILPL